MDLDNIKIAICEDQAEDMRNLMNILYNSEYKINLSTFPSGEAFLDGFEAEDFDVVFLDIYMKEMNGMDTARKIRKEDSDCTIVFTTTSKDFAIEGYKVDAMDYLVKPVQEEEVLNIIQKTIDINKEKEGPFITLISDYRKIDVPTSKIVYIEVMDKYCIFHTTEKEIKSRITMNELVEKLHRPFLRCHRSYMVNLDYVKEITTDFLMKNGDIVYIRRNDYDHIKNEYLKYLMKK